jgi:hypothetical protein
MWTMDACHDACILACGCGRTAHFSATRAIQPNCEAEKGPAIQTNTILVFCPFVVCVSEGL